MDISREFVLGFVKIHVLYHAQKESICGVDMMKELRRHGYRIGPSTLYPTLHRMQKDGYLESKKKPRRAERGYTTRPLRREGRPCEASGPR